MVCVRRPQKRIADRSRRTLTDRTCEIRDQILLVIHWSYDDAERATTRGALAVVDRKCKAVTRSLTTVVVVRNAAIVDIVLRKCRRWGT